MEFGMKTSVLFFLLFAFSANARTGSKECNFPAIFNFGDSNSDTGGANVLFFPIQWPNGLSMGKVSKRISNGRLIIDFMAESLQLPHLNSSVDAIGTSFRHGANFAVAAQRANSDPHPKSPIWNYPLSEQVSRFINFKSGAIASEKMGNFVSGINLFKGKGSESIFPEEKSFSEALYTIDIGQNDVASVFKSKSVSATLDDYSQSVKRLLDNGAKYMWIHNTCPWGCLPHAIELGCPDFKTCTHDQYGCIIEYNNLSQQYNSELKNRVEQWRKEYPNAVITLVDMYSAKHSLLTNVKGFNDELKFKQCCGKKNVTCGPLSNVCDDPSKYLSWDGTHYTETANRIVADLVLDGSFSEPRVPLLKACKKA